jgi:hypothetical protein
MPSFGSVAERWNFFREHGLDFSGPCSLKGPLTPELIDALVRLKDVLIVNETMDGQPIVIDITVPPELETALKRAFR